MDLLDLNMALELKNDNEFTFFLSHKTYVSFYSFLEYEAKNKKKLDPTQVQEIDTGIFMDFKLVIDLILPLYKEKEKISLEYILDKIFPSLEKIFIYEDGSCYYFDTVIQLYVYENKYQITLIKLTEFLKNFKRRLERIMPLFSDKLLTILKKIENILSYNDINKIGNLIKQEHNIKFNNKSFEISYKNKVLCLKTGKKRLRTLFDYYTETVDYSYYSNYYSIPSYIYSIFGEDKKNLDRIQKILGSCIIGEPLDNIILFYGSGPNSKTTIIRELSSILKSFQLNLDYSFLNIDDLKDKSIFNKKRLVTLDNIDCKGFPDVEYYINRLLSNRNFNFIGVIDNDIFLKTPKLILKKHILIEFNFSFLQNPKGNLERKKNNNLKINKNFLFTWLCKGAMKYNYEQSLEDEIDSFTYEDEDDIYSSSENIFDPDKEYLNYPEEIKKKTKSQTIYIGSGMLQQKRNYYKIGKTKQDIEKRIKVYQTGRDIEDRFICLAHFSCYDCDTIESEIKKVLNKIDPNHFNEVYNIHYNIIYSIVKELVEKYNKEAENNY